MVLALTVSGVSASVPTTECNDGSDNDGDSLVDGDQAGTGSPDPGCHKPYFEFLLSTGSREL